VLGYESGIPQEVDQAFKDTSTTHVIAISGFNITIVSSLFAILFGRILGPRRGAVAALLAISLYTAIVGGDAAVVRAAIMGGLSLYARQVGRRQHGLNSLGFTAALMAAFNPDILWDIGFQLSFAATLGLVIYAQPWEEALRAWLTTRLSAEIARRLTGSISEYLLLTLAAQLITFPLIVYHFGRLSLSSLPANVAILPAQPPVMTLGGLSVLIGSLWQPAGQILAYAVWPFVAYTIRVVELFAGWDAGVRVIGGLELWLVVTFYFVLFALTLSWGTVMETLKNNIRPAFLIGILFVVTILVWQIALSGPDNKLTSPCWILAAEGLC
jgi:competence protein ComEC